jgi:glycosyltransferase involved in cell wall biosynthesis
MTGHVRSANADIVCIEHHGLAPLLRELHATPRTAVTFEYLPSVAARHRLSTATSARARVLWWRERAKARAFERWVSHTAGAVIVTSDDDRAELSLKAFVVPNGVDTSLFVPSPLPASPRIVFTGSLDFAPNVDGIRWFVADVFPRVRAAVPSVELEIVGRRPVHEVVSLADTPGVTVIADVASIVSHLAAARVAIVPLRIGSGTRLKALEAMAAGRPIVGTSIGLAGLHLVDRRHASIEDDPDRFADAVVRLLTDDVIAAELARAGRAHVRERFSWAATGAALFTALGLDAR